MSKFNDTVLYPGAIVKLKEEKERWCIQHDKTYVVKFVHKKSCCLYRVRGYYSVNDFVLSGGAYV